MRRTSHNGGFWICFIINVVLNFEGAIPGVILLVCYFVFGIPWWLSLIAFAIWILGIIIWMFVIGWAGSCSSESRPTKNKNPYSNGRNQNPYSKSNERFMPKKPDDTN